MPQSRKPVPKVAAGAGGSGLAIVIVYVAGQFGLEMTTEVGIAFAGVISFLAGYFTKA